MALCLFYIQEVNCLFCDLEHITGALHLSFFICKREIVPMVKSHVVMSGR